MNAKRPRPHSGRLLMRRRRSTTLIEVVMALLILAISMPPLMTSFTESANQNAQPANASVAAFLAIGRMEQVIARRCREKTGYAGVTAANFPSETPVSGFPRFNRTVTITNVTATLANSGSDVGYKKVRVTVTWDGGAKQTIVERIFGNY